MTVVGDGFSVLRLPTGTEVPPDLGVHDGVDPDDLLPMDTDSARRLLREAGTDLADGEVTGRWSLATVAVLVDLTLDERGRLTELELDLGGFEGRPMQASELLHVLATVRDLAQSLGGRLFDDAGAEVGDTQVADLLRGSDVGGPWAPGGTSSPT